MATHQMTCTNCGKTFERSLPLPKGYAHAFCSRDCFYAYEKGRKHGLRPDTVVEEKACRACGKTFLIGGRDNRPKGSIYCSQDCAYSSRKGKPHADTMRQERICAQCGKKYLAGGTGGKELRSIYCSNECRYAAVRGKKRGHYADTQIEERECPTCGVTFLVGGIGNRPRIARFCSPECRQKGLMLKEADASKLIPTEAAYIAGFIDGEGSVILYGKNKTSPNILVRLTAANTKREVLEWLMEVTGLGYIVNQKRVSDKHLTGMQWVINGGGAVSILRQIRPYLILKQAQADLAIEFQDRLYIPSLKSENEWKVEYRAKMQELNRRGAAN